MVENRVNDERNKSKPQDLYKMVSSTNGGESG